MQKVAIRVACLALVACARSSGSPAAAEAPSAVTPATTLDGAAPVGDGELATIHAEPDATRDRPIADAAVPDSAVADAAQAPKPRPRKREGVACNQSSECAPGLGCCESGFTGHCGGVNMPDQERPPCVMTHTCEKAPCEPLPLPP